MHVDSQRQLDELKVQGAPKVGEKASTKASMKSQYICTGERPQKRGSSSQPRLRYSRLRMRARSV